MLEFLELVVRFATTLVVLGAVIFFIRLVLPGPEYWNRKWKKYYTTDDEQKKIDARDRRERIRKL